MAKTVNALVVAVTATTALYSARILTDPSQLKALKRSFARLVEATQAFLYRHRVNLMQGNISEVLQEALPYLYVDVEDEEEEKQKKASSKKNKKKSRRKSISDSEQEVSDSSEEELKAQNVEEPEQELNNHGDRSPFEIDDDEITLDGIPLDIDGDDDDDVLIGGNKEHQSKMIGNLMDLLEQMNEKVDKLTTQLNQVTSQTSSNELAIQSISQQVLSQRSRLHKHHRHSSGPRSNPLPHRHHELTEQHKQPPLSQPAFAISSTTVSSPNVQSASSPLSTNSLGSASSSLLSSSPSGSPAGSRSASIDMSPKSTHSNPVSPMSDVAIPAPPATAPIVRVANFGVQTPLTTARPAVYVKPSTASETGSRANSDIGGRASGSPQTSPKSTHSISESPMSESIPAVSIPAPPATAPVIRVNKLSANSSSTVNSRPVVYVKPSSVSENGSYAGSDTGRDKNDRRDRVTGSPDMSPKSIHSIPESPRSEASIPSISIPAPPATAPVVRLSNMSAHSTSTTASRPVVYVKPSSVSESGSYAGSDIDRDQFDLHAPPSSTPGPFVVPMGPVPPKPPSVTSNSSSSSRTLKPARVYAAPPASASVPRMQATVNVPPPPMTAPSGRLHRSNSINSASSYASSHGGRSTTRSTTSSYTGTTAARAWAARQSPITTDTKSVHSVQSSHSVHSDTPVRVRAGPVVVKSSVTSAPVSAPGFASSAATGVHVGPNVVRAQPASSSGVYVARGPVHVRGIKVKRCDDFDDGAN